MTLIIPKISFFLRGKTNTKTIFCRITFKGSKCEFSTGQSVNRSNFDQKKQRFSSADKSKNSIVNQLLDKITHDLKQLALLNNYVTAKDLLLDYKRNQQPKKRVNTLLKEYIVHNAKNLRAATVKKHYYILQNIELFETRTKQNLYPDNFNLQLCTKFLEWYQVQKKTKNVDNAYRNLLLVKKALDFAVLQGEIKANPLAHFNGKKDKKKKAVYLTANEVKTLEGMLLLNKMLERVKDLFLFQCYTGLSYSDIYGKWQIIKNNDRYFLKGNRTKNNYLYYLPLDNKAIAILNKYNHALPRYVNQTYNRLIKEVIALAGIEKKVTTHVARKTFATLKDANGWSRETIARMCGHNSIKTTEDYYLGESVMRVENEVFGKIG